MDASAKVTITRPIHISTEGSKGKPWNPDFVEIIEGKEFVCLSRSDCGFCRFVRGGGTERLRDCAWLEELKALRTQKSCEAVNGTPQESLFDDAPSMSNYKFKKATKNNDPDGYPSVVRVELPGFSHDGNDLPSVSCDLKFCLSKRDNVHIEITADVLQYVRAAVLKSDGESSRKRARPIVPSDKKVTWVPTRNAFVAKRMIGDTVKHKTHKPASDNAFDVEHAREKASRWADGESEGSDEEQEDDPQESNDDTYRDQESAEEEEEDECSAKAQHPMFSGPH